MAATTRHGCASSSSISAWPAACAASRPARSSAASSLTSWPAQKAASPPPLSTIARIVWVGGQLGELAAQPGEVAHVERVAALGPVDAQLADHESP